MARLAEHTRDRAPGSPVLCALSDGGFDPATVELSLLAQTWLAATYAARAPDLDAIVKIYSCNLHAHLTKDPDTRFGTFAATFPLAPFFRPTAQPTAALRAVLGDRVPRVLAEGSLAAGVRYVLMTRLPGQRWDPRTAGQPGSKAKLSLQMGELLRRMHTAPIDAQSAARGPTAWLVAYAEILHCVGDHLAELAGGGRRRRHDYHLRFHRLLERLHSWPLGPTVLAHNDFHPENLLFDDDGVITGVVDMQLACCGPAALDLRHLSTLDESAFAAGYGLEATAIDRACWIGHFFDMLWHGLALVARQRFGGQRVPLARWLQSVAHFEYLLHLCEYDAVRRGPVLGRRLTSLRKHGCVAVRAVKGKPGVPCPPTAASAKVAIVVVAWNHFATTTGPCLESVRRFTNVPYRVICVDNASSDGTRAALRSLALDDCRLETVWLDQNQGWALGSLAGLGRLRADDTHVVLLNSDTVVTPGWLPKLLWHLERDPRSTVLIPRADARPDLLASKVTRPVAPPAALPIAPGTGTLPSPAELPGVLAWAADVERDNAWRSREAAPSGFCLLFDVSTRPVVEDYLHNFAGFHARTLDWQAWWAKQRLRCRVALDCYVFHARGGSGGYYAYDRAADAR